MSIHSTHKRRGEAMAQETPSACGRRGSVELAAVGGSPTFTTIWHPALLASAIKPGDDIVELGF